MREILFRGKRLGDGEWVYGSLFIDEKKDKHEILVGYVNYHVGWEVDPGTVGQFTGLTANGTKIFEGDIVRMPYSYTVIERIKGHYGYDAEGYPKKIPGFEGYGEYPTRKTGVKNYEVKYSPKKGFYVESEYYLYGITTEVIGNIHDNPELLEATDNA